MTKSPDAFRTISEVAEWLGVQAHVLRFWESKFAQVKPVKRAGGRRYYRPTDMRLIGGIKKLLHDDGLTIKGVQKILREQGIAQVADLSQSLEEHALVDDPGAKVVPFKSKDTIDGELVSEPATLETETEPEATEVAASAEPAEAEPEGVTEQVPWPEPKPEPQFHTARAEPAEPEGALPSFLHRARTPITPPTPESPVAAQATPVEVSRRPKIVDAPDPPDDADLPYSPGALARLARMSALTDDQARQLAPLAAELRRWVNRNHNAGAA